MFTSKNLLSMATSGLRLEHVALLAFLSENAERGAGVQPTCCLPLWEIARRLGLSIDQVKRGIRVLADAAAIARRQPIKAKGEAALTVLTDRAVAWLQGRAGDAAIPAHLPRALRDLLAFETPDAVRQVVHAWDSYELLPDDTASTLTTLRDHEIEQLRAILRERVADRAEMLAEAEREQTRDQELLDDGLVSIECSDGHVVVDRHPFLDQKGAVAAVDLVFVRDVLNRVRQRAPKIVTVAKLPALIAEIGYSRTVGYVSRHDAAQALRALVATIARGTWSRPRGIRPTYYAAASTAVKLSTGVQFMRH